MGQPANAICMFTPSAGGGHARYSMELMSALAAQPANGTRFELVTSADLDPQFRSDRYPIHAILPALRNRGSFPTPAHWAANRLLHYPLRERAFLRWLAGRPDVAGVHFQEWTPWLAAPMFRRLKAMGKRAFYTVHNVVPHKYPAGVPKAVMHGWIRRACRLADVLFVHTDLLALELHRFLNGDGRPGRDAPHPPIRVVPHGVWTVAEAAANGVPLADRLASKRLLFFGTIRRNKGLDLLLRAMELLPGYSLTIAGEPSEPDYFRAEVLPRVERLRAAGVPVELLDRFTPDEEVGPLFARHGAVVLPYTSGFVAQSGVAFLALAHGLPVVASEAGGLRDLLAEFRVGATFRDSAPAALAAAVRSLCDGGGPPDLAAQLRAARDRYSWRAAAAATVAGYHAAVPEGRSAADARLVAPVPAH